MKNIFFFISPLTVWIFKSKIIISLLLSIIILCCDQQPRKPIEGAWNIVYGKRVAADTLVWEFPGYYTGSQIKVWTKDHFVFVGQFKSDTTITNNYGGGTYTIDSNRYEETLSYHTNSDWVDVKMKMLVEIKGDSLIQTWPVDDNWQINTSDYRVEKYTRLK